MAEVRSNPGVRSEKKDKQTSQQREGRRPSDYERTPGGAWGQREI